MNRYKDQEGNLNSQFYTDLAEMMLDREAWAVLTALRGPDDLYAYDKPGAETQEPMNRVEVKLCTTAVIRKIIFDRAKQTPSDMYYVIDDSEVTKIDRRQILRKINSRGRFGARHFAGHIQNAFLALGLEPFEPEPFV